MVWAEVISKAGSYLAAHGVDEGQTSAELLSARLLGIGRGFLAGYLDKEVEERQLEAMRRGMRRLVEGEPIQYVIGEWDFRTLTLKCDKRALIPRPETEELVTRVLKYLKEAERATGRTDFCVIDVGTGTGAIILSLAKEFGKGIFIGTDISEAAIELAKENAEKVGVGEKVKFVVADGLDDFDEPGLFDVIVSNPPYIKRSVVETLERKVKDFEPRLALDGGESGLDFYDRYLMDAYNLLKPGGAVFFEIGEDQGEEVEKLMLEYGFEDIKIERDFAGHNRYAMAKVGNNS